MHALGSSTHVLDWVTEGTYCCKCTVLATHKVLQHRLRKLVEGQRNNKQSITLHLTRMTSPESMSESSHSVGSSWNNVGQPVGLSTTDDISMVPGTMIPRHQPSLLGVDVATGPITDNLSLARPGYNTATDLATTREAPQEEAHTPSQESSELGPTRAPGHQGYLTGLAPTL